ncbi:aluminum-activated malate transporter 9-like protein isoform X3 [Cinnamomum micranthum f. kanehirae]|uniref:Aluminum-activated malate transporter 9-like protein isoform X3 n=1 Tax=Cinnamomum micranthum f. kanehirae TaxID=337451 RepID=A0A3S3PY02_9MAGN|nr:aluminum-activated malate transporter 9-like protein isoform X3 [Cinnamomum micranthum f. kanehirae]
MKERLLERDVVLGYHSEQGIRSKFVCFSSFRDWISKLWKQLLNLITIYWEFGRSDPRKVIFSAKMSLALTVISLLIFWKDSDTDISRYSVWAIITVPLVFQFSNGEELHNLVVKIFMVVANSLEGGFATWEPPHGPYKMMRYPWKNYIKVGGALRHSAFMVMALHGCLLSEMQAPPEGRQVFSAELLIVGIEGAKLLRELGNKVKAMVKLNPGDILLVVHEAAEELQKKIRLTIIPSCQFRLLGDW